MAEVRHSSKSVCFSHMARARLKLGLTDQQLNLTVVLHHFAHDAQEDCQRFFTDVLHLNNDVTLRQEHCRVR